MVTHLEITKGRDTLYDAVVNAIIPTFSMLSNKVLTRPYILKCKQAKPYGRMNEEHNGIIYDRMNEE